MFNKILNFKNHAPVAQLDRALGYDQEVLGSNPSRRTIFVEFFF